MPQHRLRRSSLSLSFHEEAHMSFSSFQPRQTDSCWKPGPRGIRQACMVSTWSQRFDYDDDWLAALFEAVDGRSPLGSK